MYPVLSDDILSHVRLAFLQFYNIYYMSYFGGTFQMNTHVT